MYSEAYDTYDSTNTILSLGSDGFVRKTAARKALEGLGPKRIIDIATGTGDTALEIALLAKKEKIKAEIIGLDTNSRMLGVAKKKIKSSGINGVRFWIGDALHTGFGPNGFDVVISSFSIKNFNDLEMFSRESYRILKKGGRFIVTDISRPESAFGNAVFEVYTGYMKLVGILANRKLYRWLPGSTADFDRSEFVKIVRKSGFSDIKIEEFLFGIAYMLTCRK